MVPPAGLIRPRSSQALLCHRATPARGRPRGTDEQVRRRESDAGVRRPRRPADVDPMLRFISYQLFASYLIAYPMFYVRGPRGRAMGTSSTQAARMHDEIAVCRLHCLAVHHFDPLRDRHDARDTRQRAGGRVYGKVRAACWMAAQRGSAPTRVRPSRRRRCACNILGRRARSLAREFGGGGALTPT